MIQIEPSSSWRRLRNYADNRVVVKEPQGSELRRLISGLAGVAGTLVMTWIGSSATTVLNFGLPVYVHIAGWAMLFASAHDFFFPSRVTLRVGADAVSIRVGSRPKLVIPLASVRSSEHRFLRTPSRITAPRSSASESERVFGQTVGNAVRVQYVDEDLRQRSFTFGTDDARHVLEALKRSGVRTERQ